MSANVRFLLDAECSPGLLPRLLQPLARRDLTPDRMWSHRSGDTMHVEIALHSVPEEEVHLVEGNLRQIVGVLQVVQVRPDRLHGSSSRGQVTADFNPRPRERVAAMAGGGD
jgi:hypothetical protein